MKYITLLYMLPLPLAKLFSTLEVDGTLTHRHPDAGWWGAWQANTHHSIDLVTLMLGKKDVLHTKIVIRFRKDNMYSVEILV